MDSRNADSQISYNKKLIEMKNKYGPLLEMLIKEKKANGDVNTVYSALTEGRLSHTCLLKIETVLEKIRVRLKNFPQRSNEVPETISSDSSTSRNTTEDPGAAEKSSGCPKMKTKQSRWDVQPDEMKLKKQEKNSLNPLPKDKESKLHEKGKPEIINVDKESNQLNCNDIAQKRKQLSLQLRTNIQNNINATDGVVSVDLTGDDNEETTNATPCTPLEKNNEMVRNEIPRNNNGETVENKITTKVVSDVVIGPSIKNKTDSDIEIVASVSGKNSFKKEKNTSTGFEILKEVDRSFTYHKVRTDNMMSKCQIAHMKHGTVLDLVDEKETSKQNSRKRPPPTEIESLEKKKFGASTDKFCNETSGYKYPRLSVKTHPSQTNDLNKINTEITPNVDNTSYKNLQSAVEILGLNANEVSSICKDSLSNTDKGNKQSFETTIREPLLPTPVERPYDHISVHPPQEQIPVNVTFQKPTQSFHAGHPYYYQKNSLNSSYTGMMFETTMFGQGNKTYPLMPTPQTYHRVPAVLCNLQVQNAAGDNVSYPIKVLTTNASSDISHRDPRRQVFNSRQEVVEERGSSSMYCFTNQTTFPSRNNSYCSRKFVQDPQLRHAESLHYEQPSNRNPDQRMLAMNNNIKMFENPNSSFDACFKRDNPMSTNSKSTYLNRTDNFRNYYNTSRPIENGYYGQDNPRASIRNFSHPIETHMESRSMHIYQDRYVSPSRSQYKGSELNCRQPSSNRFNDRQLKPYNKLNTEQSETYNTNRSRLSELRDLINDRQLDTPSTTIITQSETQNGTINSQSESHKINCKHSEVNLRQAVVENKVVRVKNLNTEKSSDETGKKTDCFTSNKRHSQCPEETDSVKRSTEKESNAYVCDSTQEMLTLDKKTKKTHLNVSQNLKQSAVKVKNTVTNLNGTAVRSPKASNEKKLSSSKIENHLNVTKNQINRGEENSSSIRKVQTKKLALNQDKLVSRKEPTATDKKDYKIKTIISVKDMAKTKEKSNCQTKKTISIESNKVKKFKYRKCSNRIIYSDSSECSESETINTSSPESNIIRQVIVPTSKKCSTKGKVSKNKLPDVQKENVLIKPKALDTKTPKITDLAAGSDSCKVSQKVDVKSSNSSKKLHVKKKINTKKEFNDECPNSDVLRDLLEKTTSLLKNPEAVKAICDLASFFEHLKPARESLNLNELNLNQSTQNFSGESSKQHTVTEEKVNFMEKHCVVNESSTSTHSSVDTGSETRKEEQSRSTIIHYVKKSQVIEVVPERNVIDIVAKKSIADNNSNVVDSTNDDLLRRQVCSDTINIDIDNADQLHTPKSHCQEITQPSCEIPPEDSSRNKAIILNPSCSVRCNSRSQDNLSVTDTNSNGNMCLSDEIKEKEGAANEPGDSLKDCDVSSKELNTKDLANIRSPVKCKKAKRSSELEKIQASLQSSPGYDNLMKYTGLRSCRIKNNPPYNPQKVTNITRKRTYKRKIRPSLDSSSEGSSECNSQLSPVYSNKEGSSKELDVSFEGTMSKPTSPSSPSMSTLTHDKESQDLQHTCTRPRSEARDIEIVDVFSLCEENCLTSDEECFTIAKEFLRYFEKELESSQMLAASSMHAENIDNEDDVPNKSTEIESNVDEYETESVVLNQAKADGDHGGWKDPVIYQQMLSQEKLKHFYKCMHRHCSFTHHLRTDFAQHLNLHVKLDEFSAPVLCDWRLCAYCPYMERSGNVESYLNHLHLIHGRCSLQCQYCLFRGPTYHFIVSHQNEKHPGQAHHVLKCIGELQPQ